MTIFQLIRQEVTAEDAAKLYGLEFGRNGRARCPWHDDHNPDLKFLSSGLCYCHACHKSGDAVALTAQMLGVTHKEAAERIRHDFHLDAPTTNRPDPTASAKVQQRRDERDKERRRWGYLCDVVREADTELRRFDMQSAWDNPRFVQLLKAMAIANDMLDYLWETENEHKQC